LTRALVIDGGQSGCRVAWHDGERVVAQATALGLRRRSGSAQVLQDAIAGLDPAPAAVDVVAAGLTGFDGTRATARAIADGLREAVRADIVLVTTDAVTSYLGALGPRAGVVVAAGTGAIALAADGDGRLARSDGWGYLLGDDGGAFAIGRAGLRSALREHDGRGGSAALRERARARFGPLDAIAGEVYDGGDPVGTLAAFAQDVADAARAGDPEAAEVWASAARELAAATAAAAAHLFPVRASIDVSWNGGLFGAGDLLAAPFVREVRKRLPGARVAPPRGTALDGAALLAQTHPVAMFGSLVHACEA
jgi:N-acetylglucosamine kinase-like BadF-type ATPase